MEPPSGGLSCPERRLIDMEAMVTDAMLADAPAPALPGFARVAGQFDDAADDDGGGFDDL